MTSAQLAPYTLVFSHHHERIQPKNPGCEYPGCYDRSCRRAKSRRSYLCYGTSETRPVGASLSTCLAIQLTPRSSRALIENAVESCLRLPKLSPEIANKARLLRAKARLAASLHAGAHQGRGPSRLPPQIHSRLTIRVSPPSPSQTWRPYLGLIPTILKLVLSWVALSILARYAFVASSLAMCSSSSERSSFLPQNAHQRNQTPGFSTEVWREIAKFLPRRDLKTLLLLPHVLSRIASQLLFRRIDLHFGTLSGRCLFIVVYRPTTALWTDKEHAQQSADILTRIITDSSFASHVKTLRIFVPGRDTFPMTFQTGKHMHF